MFAFATFVSDNVAHVIVPLEPPAVVDVMIMLIVCAVPETWITASMVHPDTVFFETVAVY